MGMTGSADTIALSVCVDPYVITEFYVMDVASPQNAILRRSWIRPHDESGPILLPPAFAASHSDGNGRHKRGPNHVLKHCRHSPEAVRVDDEECEGGL